jgi:hypothetical protein
MRHLEVLLEGNHVRGFRSLGGEAAAAQPELSEEEAGARQLREKRCLIASCMDDMCNCDEVLFLFYSMSTSKDNGLFRIVSN